VRRGRRAGFRACRVGAVAPLLGLVTLGGCSGGLGSLEDMLSPERRGALARVGAAAMPMSTEMEVDIGRSVAGTVVAREPILDDEPLQRYVELVGHAVAQQSPRRGELRFHFAVLDEDEVNAYAAPGGYIFITRGSLEVMESEAELAAVLAHEIAHVDGRHVVEEIRRADVYRTVQEEADLGGEVLERITGVGSSLLFTGLSRGDEMEADSLAILYTAATGYRPDALLTFLERLSRMADDPGQAGRLRQLRSTHPPAEDRIEAVGRILTGSGLEGRGLLLEDRFRERTTPSP
jgi:beta-barrel assembly-enhancing protease